MAQLKDTKLFTDANLIAYYRFENGAQTTDSKGSNTLTASGSPAANSAGMFGYCVDFGALNVTPNYYKVTASDLGINGNGSISMSTWVKIQTAPALNTTHAIMQHASTVGADRYLRMLYRDITTVKNLAIDCSGTITNFAVDLGTSAWHHIVVIRDITNSLGYLYVDGVQQISNATLGSGAYGAKRFDIGADEDGTYLGISAFEDDTAVFNRVLTSLDCWRLYSDANLLMMFQ